MTHRRKSLNKTDPQVIAEAERFIEYNVRYEYETYLKERQWSGNSGLKEPSITLGVVAGYVRRHLSESAPYLPNNTSFTKWAYSVARAALSRLVRSGKLRTSLGVGLNGQEARCYEPGV